MATQVTLPQLGESVDSGTIVAWLVEVGDEVAFDQAVAEVSTDKVDTEIPSPAAGRVTRLLADIDDVVAVGQPILELDGGDDASDDVSEPTGASDDVAAPAGASDDAAAQPRPSDPESYTAAEVVADAPVPAGDVGDERRSGGARGTGRADAGPLSPLVKRLLREHGLAAGDVTGSGAGGRVTPDDVRAMAQRTRPRLSPLVKRLLREHDLVPSGVVGSGRDGRITPADVMAAVEAPAEQPDQAQTGARSPAGAPAPVGTAAAADGAPAVAASPTAAPPHQLPGDRVEPLSRTRRIIAQRMLASLQTTAQLTAAVEADVTRIMHVRAAVNAAHRARHGTSLSPLAFIARATTKTLQRHPLLNASIDLEGGEVVFHTSVNLGLAVDAPQGLVVPTIRDAQDLNVVGLQRRIADLATRARDRKLTPDDIGGGTFTITNTGSRGSLFDTPILNPPEVGILATPTIEKRPVVVTDDFGNDTFAVRHRTYLCLSYDHRLVDGADAARFLSDLAAELDREGWDHEVAELA
ncbi:2-oxo acid dehydrogenase subunit E2 [Egicoccus sp. AB-alg6-2]|uniref:2-oxo acid dehydrogenase subunit E2 n=1 Tax=Egicoccus sp. AB-alg6-2 TaxID=3242692 RepID=UPI00359EA8EA